MVRLISPPALGFETATSNAKEYYYERKMRHSQRKIEPDVFAKTAWKVANVVKVLGYIPLIGSFIGLARILKARASSQDEMPNRYHHIARGSVEFLSLGILLLIPDLIMTSYRAFGA